MKISAEFRMPVSKSTKRHHNGVDERATDHRIPGETLGDVNVVSSHS